MGIPSYKQQTIPTEEKSVQNLVSAGLDLLKAGKKLKFNVDVKNPEALLGAKKTSQEGGLTWEKERGCHWPCHWKHHHCWCPHEDSEEPTNPTEEKSSVQNLVSAGLDLLKAGKKLKFNVDVKNPEALLSKDDTSKPKQRFRAYWPKPA